MKAALRYAQVCGVQGGARLTVPVAMIGLVAGCAREFSNPVGRLAQGQRVGAIVAPPKRTVTAALRAMGLSHDRPVATDRPELNGDQGSRLRLSRILRGLRVTRFVAVGLSVRIGIDERIERRWGPKRIERGLYREPVRARQRHGVNASGLRWLSGRFIVDRPWMGRAWALPFLSVVAPSWKKPRPGYGWCAGG